MPRERRLILIVMCFALATVVSAVSSLNVALPDLARATGATSTELQWIVDAYALVFAGLLLLAGNFGDRFGRRLILISGLTIFGSGAVVATTVSEPSTLIAVRAFMGLGAAMIMPATLSIITATFPDGEREKAVGMWAGVAGGSAILGLLVSGAILEFADWPAIFILSTVLASVALIGTLKFVPAFEGEKDINLDPVGGLLSAFGLVALCFAFIEGPDHGWTSGLVVGGFAAAAVLIGAFLVWELRQEKPLLDPRLFKLGGFSGGSLSIFVQFFAAFGLIFVMLQYLQLVLGYSTLQAGAALAPTALMVVTVAPRIPKLMERLDTHLIGPAGLVMMAIGFFIFSGLGIGSSYSHVLAGGLILGLGMAFATTPATSAIVESLPAEKQGVASAVNDAAREVGGALGIAVLGSVLSSQVKDFGPGFDPASFVDGFSSAMIVGAIVLLTGAVIVAIRERKPSPEGAAYAQPSIRVGK